MSKLFYPALTKEELSGIPENNETNNVTNNIAYDKEMQERKEESIKRKNEIANALTLLGQDEKVINSIANKFARLIYNDINTHLSDELASHEKIMKYREETIESHEKIMKYHKKATEFREKIMKYHEKAIKSREQIINGLEAYITTYINQCIENNNIENNNIENNNIENNNIENNNIENNNIENNNTPKQLVIDHFNNGEFTQIFADAGIDNINSLCKHLQIMIGFIGQEIQYKFKNKTISYNSENQTISYNSENQLTQFNIVNKESTTEVLKDAIL